MTRTARRSTYRVVLAIGMVAALVNCGGSGDSSSDTRQRNAALECLPGDPAETTTTIENDPCAETTTTLYEDASRTVTCDVTWEPASVSAMATACPEATYLEVTYPNVTGGTDSASNQGNPGNAVGIGQYAEGTATVTVHIMSADGQTEIGVGTVQFETNVAATKSFTYESAAPSDTSTSVPPTEYKGPEVNCLVYWTVERAVITSCEGTTSMLLQFFNEAGEEVGSAGALSENPAPGIAVPEGARYVDVKVFIPKAFGPENEPAGVVRLDTTIDTSNSTFVYHEAVSAPVEDTTTTVAEQGGGEETTTTAGETPEAIAATVSVQEVPCEASYTAETRVVRLCENFDRTVGAAFNAEGKFSETIETGYGNTFTLPANLVEGGGARFVRIAVGQIMNGLEGGIPVFRGEGILDLGDGTADVQGTIYVSPSGQEALNTGGYPDYMSVELTNAGLFDIDGIDENELAFVTLDGQVFPEYENVKPPATWDEGEALKWRAYQTDGFGLPRLVASGMLALGSDAELEYMNPTFELNSQRVELIAGPDAGTFPSTEGLSEDPCGAVDPYMITTPITPSRTNMVTLTVATDCASVDSLLGLVVYDYDEDWIPVFSQFKSTRFSTRLVATTFLADGEYDILWGDFDLVGIHEYVVNGGGSGATCHHPLMDVDPGTLKATLRDCDPGAHRMRVYAEPLFWTEDSEDIRLPYKDGVIDLQMVPWEGYFEVNLRIDDSFEPDFITCVKACEGAQYADDGVQTTFDASNFAEDASVNVTSKCAEPAAPEGEGWSKDWGWAYTDLYRSAGEGSFVYESWMWLGDVPWRTSYDETTRRLHFPSNGTILSVTECMAGWWNEATYDWTETRKAAINSVEITAPMPNRPSNDRFENAPAIEPGVGRINFTNVSSTNELGEMGIEYSNSADEGQFHSVWFTHTPTETGPVTFRIADFNFDVLMRVTSRDEQSRTVLHGESEMWVGDDLWCECDPSEIGSVTFNAVAGTTYYIQVTNEDYENQVGTATLVVNDGEGETVTVPKGDEPFASSRTLQQQAPATTVPTVPLNPSTTTTSTVAAPVDTVPAGSPTTTAAPTPAEQGYSAARDQGSRNEVVTVLAPVGDAPATVEARKDATTVQIPVADLYGTVSAASAKVDTARSLMIRQPGRRPIRVRPSDRIVSVPVGTEVTDLSIVATTTDGKTVAAPLTVKKTVAPLVKVAGSGDSDGSGLPVLPIGIALGVLVLAGAGLTLRRRGATTAGDTPSDN
jgi:hypothetical protein